jgi:NADPH:quinone reductase-like Zn-dependent oxidoreductase
VACCDGPLVRVEAAGFNYKDALACSGHPGVAKTLPLIPGIDAAGTLVEAAAGLPAGCPRRPQAGSRFSGCDLYPANPISVAGSESRRALR